MNREVYVFIYYTVENESYLLTPCTNLLETMEYYKHYVHYSLQKNLILSSAFLTNAQAAYANNLLDQGKNKEALEAISRESRLKDEIL